MLGENAFGAATPPQGRFVQLVTGEFHSCALRNDGVALCWGLGSTAAPPDADAGASATPDIERPWGQAMAPADQKFQRLAVGLAHSCGILESGDVQCWGAGKTAGACSSVDTCGQAVFQTGPFLEIGLGYTNSCGILASGSIKCWGSNSGNRSTPPSTFQY